MCNYPKFSWKISAKNVSENVKTVQCDLCELWVHIKCNNLNYLDYRYLQNSNESWYCIECCSTIFPFNSLSLNKTFDDLQHPLSCTKTKFDIIAIRETRITRQVSLLNNLNLNNYSFEFTPTETSAGGTLLYIANHLSYKCRNDLNIYKKMNWNLLLLKLLTRENQILLWESFTDIHLWTLLTLIAITWTNY